jgi:hypothetical protein
MMRKIWIMALSVFVGISFSGCGMKTFNTLSIEESTQYYERMQPNDESDIVYLFSNDNDPMWRMNCKVNNNPIGEFKCDNYQILRLYKDVGPHKIECKYWGHSDRRNGRDVENKHKSTVDETFTITPKGNGRHYIEYSVGFMNIHSGELSSAKEFDENKLRLTDECYDCMRKAPRRPFKIPEGM